MFALARIHLAAFKEISKFMIASFDHFDRQAKSKVLWSCDNLLRVWVHFPILLEGGGLKRGPSPFRFENMWLEEEGFKDKMKTWWGSLNFTGSSSYILDAKLRALKNILKIWNKEEFGLVEAQRVKLLSRLSIGMKRRNMLL